jgi:hypothetical protein
MYVRTTTRKNKDGSVVRYLQLAESVWDAENRRSQTRVLHNLGLSTTVVTWTEATV